MAACYGKVEDITPDLVASGVNREIVENQELSEFARQSENIKKQILSEAHSSGLSISELSADMTLCVSLQLIVKCSEIDDGCMLSPNPKDEVPYQNLSSVLHGLSGTKEPLKISGCIDGKGSSVCMARIYPLRINYASKELTPSSGYNGKSILPVVVSVEQGYSGDPEVFFAGDYFRIREAVLGFYVKTQDSEFSGEGGQEDFSCLLGQVESEKCPMLEKIYSVLQEGACGALYSIDNLELPAYALSAHLNRILRNYGPSMAGKIDCVTEADAEITMAALNTAMPKIRRKALDAYNSYA
jgi:hypothetical protein